MAGSGLLAFLSRKVSMKYEYRFIDGYTFTLYWQGQLQVAFRQKFNSPLPPSPPPLFSLRKYIAHELREKVYLHNSESSLCPTGIDHKEVDIFFTNASFF